MRLGELDLELETLGVPDTIPDKDWVVVSAPGLDTDGREPEASKYISHLGGEATAHLDTLILLKKAGLKEEFNPATLREAEVLRPGAAGRGQGRAHGPEDIDPLHHRRGRRQGL